MDFQDKTLYCIMPHVLVEHAKFLGGASVGSHIYR
jgi:hypothetical protein